MAISDSAGSCFHGVLLIDAIPQLEAMAKDTEGAVVMAAAKSLIKLGDEKGYEAYYAVLTGQRKSGDSLIGGEEKELSHLHGGSGGDPSVLVAEEGGKLTLLRGKTR